MNYPESEIKIPVLKGVRAEIIKSEEELTEYEASILHGTRTISIESPVNIKSITGDGIISERVNDKKWKIIIPDSSTEQKQDVKILSSKLTDAGVFLCTAVVPEKIKAEIIMIIRGAEKAAPLTTINGSGTDNSTLVGEGWRLIKLNCVSGTNEIRMGVQGIERAVSGVPVQVYLSADSKLKTHRIKIIHDALSPENIYNKPFPILQNLSEYSSKIIEKKVTLSSASSLLRGYRALKPEQIDKITNAVLKLKRFDVNGGKYAEKNIYVNGKYIGIIPPNPPPLSKWKECEIVIPKEVLKGLKLDNKISLKDNTGDAYKIKDFEIEVVLDDGKQVATAVNPIIYSTSLEWELGEGEKLSRDGTSITILSF